MTEQRFIRLNQGRWEEFEKALQSPDKKSPDVISDLYSNVIDDLSYARTHYAGSEIVTYLNNLAVRAHTYIHGTKREKRNRLVKLYKTEIPLAVLRNSIYLKVSSIVFIGCMALGIFSSVLDPAFPRMILGDTYVNQTLENIEAGDPMAIYKSMSKGGMFTRIAINNVRVAFMAFVMGIGFGIPTILILISNGVMVGGFLTFFAQQDQLGVALSTIFLHGAMELSAIVISGACGLIIGTNWIFPGTYKRSVALVRGATG